MRDLGIKAIYVKIHHGTTANGQALLDLGRGFARDWRALGVAVLGWGWCESNTPHLEADLAVQVCRTHDLDGYIANCEDPYEFSGAWKSAVFVEAFRARAPHAPLGLSYIGDGYPHRALDFTPWVRDGAALMPQSYWATEATSLDWSVWAAQRAGLPMSRLFPTLGTSGFQSAYPAAEYAQELHDWALRSWSVWLLESTTDDYLRALPH